MQLTLISMPWAFFNRPSIQLGALKSYLQKQDGAPHVSCLHPSLDLAKHIGPPPYRIISENNWAGEALYAALLFPKQYRKTKDLFRQTVGKENHLAFDALLEHIRSHSETLLAQIRKQSPDLIGFSICFSQLTPSLYIAHKIKEDQPDVPIVFGGSTCTPEIGSSLLQVFPQINYVITGEGETPLLELSQYISGNKTELSDAILKRECANSQKVNASHQEIKNLDALPTPDYDDYFRELNESGLGFIPVLPMEFSRGCWWNKCSFCNLNLQWCGYRAKSAAKMQDELQQLQKSYHCLDFTFTDNALPPREAKTFFSSIAEKGLDIRFFGEIRAKGKAKQYKQYAIGGLTSVQVGIEALSNSLLAQMDKGATVMDNVAVMKFAIAAGIRLDGNLILDFPGSTDAQAEETLSNLDVVLPYHPLSAVSFFLGHGSPVCNNPHKFGIQAILQHPHNKKIYPPELLQQLVMMIKSYRGDRMQQKKRWQPIRTQIQKWQTFHANRSGRHPSALTYRDGEDFLIIRQEKPGCPPLNHRLRGTSRRIYLACEEPIDKKELPALFPSIRKKQLNGFLADLVKKRLLFIDNEKCLALAVHDQTTPC